MGRVFAGSVNAFYFRSSKSSFKSFIFIIIRRGRRYRGRSGSAGEEEVGAGDAGGGQEGQDVEGDRPLQDRVQSLPQEPLHCSEGPEQAHRVGGTGEEVPFAYMHTYIHKPVLLAFCREDLHIKVRGRGCPTPVDTWVRAFLETSLNASHIYIYTYNTYIHRNNVGYRIGYCR